MSSGYACEDCGRVIESNPRCVGGMAFCEGCWFARQQSASSNAHAAASLGWASVAIKVVAIMGAIYLGAGGLSAL